MEEITRFVMFAQSDRFTVTELCEQFGISRKTGYKHLERYAAAGLKGLQSRSHRPHQFPQRTDEVVEALLLAERRLHRTWGPKKLHKVLQVKHGIESPPARSTIGEILRRHGLSVRRRRKPGACILMPLPPPCIGSPATRRPAEDCGAFFGCQRLAFIRKPGSHESGPSWIQRLLN